MANKNVENISFSKAQYFYKLLLPEFDVHVSFWQKILVLKMTLSPIQEQS